MLHKRHRTVLVVEQPLQVQQVLAWVLELVEEEALESNQGSSIEVSMQVHKRYCIREGTIVVVALVEAWVVGPFLRSSSVRMTVHMMQDMGMDMTSASGEPPFAIRNSRCCMMGNTRLSKPPYMCLLVRVLITVVVVVVAVAVVAAVGAVAVVVVVVVSVRILQNQINWCQKLVIQK